MHKQDFERENNYALTFCLTIRFALKLKDENNDEIDSSHFFSLKRKQNKNELKTLERPDKITLLFKTIQCYL